jgi:hypothetical protein
MRSVAARLGTLKAPVARKLSDFESELLTAWRTS